MDIKVVDEKIASADLVQMTVIEQLAEMGFKVHDGTYAWTVTAPEPIRVEDIRGGFLFMRTYHKWWWKIISNVRFHIKEHGKYILNIEVPHRDDLLLDVKEFIQGLQEKLGDLRESLEINFIYVRKFGEYQTDNIPTCYY